MIGSWTSLHAKQRSEINIKKMEKTDNLRHLLTELIRTHDLEPKMLEQKVFALWRKHLGAPLGTKTVPVSLSNGILKIYTEYSPYITELSLHKPKILADLNAELGKSVLIDFRVELRPGHAALPDETEGGSSSSKAPKEDSIVGNTHPVTPEQLEKIEQALASVPDAELKKSLWQLFTTQSKDKP